MTRIRFRSTQKALWYAMLAAAALLGAVAHAHEGESHDEPALAPEADPASVRRSFSGAGDALELTVIYDTRTAIAGSPVPLLLLLADKFTNEPQDGARLELTLSGGTSDANLSASPSGSPGAYAVAATLATGTQYSLLVDVSIDGVSDFFSIDRITLPEPVEAGHTHDETTLGNPIQAPVLWIVGAVGATIAGFVAGRLTGREQKEGAK